MCTKHCNIVVKTFIYVTLWDTGFTKLQHLLEPCPLDWIKLYIGMKFQQFSRNTTHVSINGKLSELHFKISLFSNQGDKVLKNRKAMGKISPVLSTRIRTLSLGLENNNWLKWSSDTIPTMLTCVILLETFGTKNTLWRPLI